MAINVLGFSTDDALLFSVATDQALRVWDAAEAREVLFVDDLPSLARDGDWPQRGPIYLGHEDGAIRTFDPTTGVIEQVWLGAHHPIHSLSAVLPAGAGAPRLLVTDGTGAARLVRSRRRAGAGAAR
jgi:hypothetical protein